MYLPPANAVSVEETARLLDGVNAADLITAAPTGMLATFLPLLMDAERGSMLGHVARGNQHWVEGAGHPSLVIVRGPDAYVSPSWYPAKAEHGRVVPTWNYVTAHVHGTLLVHDDPEWVRDIVTRLTDRHERNLPSPWAVTDAPAAYLDGMLQGIVGVELRIERVTAKAKLSQNRSEADQRGVVTGLTAGDPDSQVAALMRNHVN